MSIKESRPCVVLRLLAYNLPQIAMAITHSNKIHVSRLGGKGK